MQSSSDNQCVCRKWVWKTKHVTASVLDQMQAVFDSNTTVSEEIIDTIQIRNQCIFPNAQPLSLTNSNKARDHLCSKQ